MKKFSLVFGCVNLFLFSSTLVASIHIVDNPTVTAQRYDSMALIESLQDTPEQNLNNNVTVREDGRAFQTWVARENPYTVQVAYKDLLDDQFRKSFSVADNDSVLSDAKIDSFGNTVFVSYLSQDILLKRPKGIVSTSSFLASEKFYISRVEGDTDLRSLGSVTLNDPSYISMKAVSQNRVHVVGTCVANGKKRVFLHDIKIKNNKASFTQYFLDDGLASDVRNPQFVLTERADSGSRTMMQFQGAAVWEAINQADEREAIARCYVHDPTDDSVSLVGDSQEMLLKDYNGGVFKSAAITFDDARRPVASMVISREIKAIGEEYDLQQVGIRRPLATDGALTDATWENDDNQHAVLGERNSPTNLSAARTSSGDTSFIVADKVYSESPTSSYSSLPAIYISTLKNNKNKWKVEENKNTSISPGYSEFDFLGTPSMDFDKDDNPIACYTTKFEGHAATCVTFVRGKYEEEFSTANVQNIAVPYTDVDFAPVGMKAVVPAEQAKSYNFVAPIFFRRSKMEFDTVKTFFTPPAAVILSELNREYNPVRLQQ